jgi:hypothetical protein
MAHYTAEFRGILHTTLCPGAAKCARPSYDAKSVRFTDSCICGRTAGGGLVVPGEALLRTDSSGRESGGGRAHPKPLTWQHGRQWTKHPSTACWMS